jgi:UDP-N-acetylmuramate dehydrogenase
MNVEENVPLSQFTTFHLGGPAKFFIRASSIDELREALNWVRTRNLETLILGGGSNLLVSDAGFDGAVISIGIDGIEQDGEMLIAGAGHSWDKLVEYAIKENLWGIENLSGIPGTVGGAVVQGIGAYGAAVGQTLAWCEALDPSSGEVVRMNNQECAFDYRDSAFKHTDLIVVRVAFALSRTPRPQTLYKDVAELFKDSAPTLEALRAAILSIRKGKFPDLKVEGTAGSFFKNPILPMAAADVLKATFPDMPTFAMPETTGVKIPLAWLIDKALNLKSSSVGGARLFEHQSLVIVAKEGASADDVKKLSSLVKKTVQEKLKIKIEEEVKILP